MAIPGFSLLFGELYGHNLVTSTEILLIEIFLHADFTTSSRGSCKYAVTKQKASGLKVTSVCETACTNDNRQW